jgi:hypothetical protein
LAYGSPAESSCSTAAIFATAAFFLSWLLVTRLMLYHSSSRFSDELV